MSTDQTALNGDHDHTGRFTVGNRSAANRSSRASELRRAFVSAITTEDVAEIAAALVTAAKAGDIAAAKLLLDRLGRPGTDDGDPLEIGRSRLLAILSRTTGESDQ